jgi:hypothetical protein
VLELQGLENVFEPGSKVNMYFLGAFLAEGILGPWAMANPSKIGPQETAFFSLQKE